MRRDIRALAAAVGFVAAITAANAALAQKQGGILRLSHFDSPASMSILEESTRATLQPMMHVFNNLIMYKQDVAQNSCNRLCRILQRAGRGVRTEPN